MEITSSEICKLCEQKKALRESHIIPKFVFRWLKQTGGKYIRKADNVNKRVEDGVKDYLLCDDCEELFSKLENKFAREIFYPYSNKNIDSFNYDQDLLKFSISVLYRILLINHNDKQSFDNIHFNALIKAENEWRNFLYSNQKLESFKNIHIYFASAEKIKNVLPTERFLNFYLRGIDGTIVSNIESCIVYVKMARIILIGEIEGFDNSEMKNTLINMDAGEILAKETKMNPLFNEFFIDRVRQINGFFDKVSDQQKNNAINYSNWYKENYPNSDIVEILEKEGKKIIDDRLNEFE